MAIPHPYTLDMVMQFIAGASNPVEMCEETLAAMLENRPEHRDDLVMAIINALRHDESPWKLKLERNLAHRPRLDMADYAKMMEIGSFMYDELANGVHLKEVIHRAGENFGVKRTKALQALSYRRAVDELPRLTPEILAELTIKSNESVEQATSADSNRLDY